MSVYGFLLSEWMLYPDLRLVAMKHLKILFLCMLSALAFSGHNKYIENPKFFHDVPPNVSHTKSFATHLAGFLVGCVVSYGARCLSSPMNSPLAESAAALAATCYTAKLTYQQAGLFFDREPSEEFCFRLASSVLEGWYCTHLWVNKGNLIPSIH